ncbi:TPA: cupin domain-containing protein [Pseudomonas aeruginosa]|uniref:cupin domain-containing protein n=1 Tax=Pseudomonas TaxID=286 RepID=UPI000D21759E|nr:MULTISPECIES: cupin domain-containing protein [Pseudomonas]AVZ17531.1 DUF861 domain-containing protein [Pseudomonas aeruginosa]MCT5442800.1 cupin domain-containing protein [Pseudomonas aeruginosa]HBO0069023.1 DUF861 domain-containing protein [Pseudomonas aeruginosa]HCL3892798.1 DUF861 domain-containing protein [Pseudomonas aeruginosa]
MEQLLPAGVIDFANPTIAEARREISDPALVDTPYSSSSWRHFTSDDQKAAAGFWEAPAHLHRCEFAYAELCHLLKGDVRLTDSNGVAKTFGPGDSFLVQKGFKGVWENLSDVRKVYFILA